MLNADDACPQVEGEPADDDYNGCPRVQRELSASFADEVVTGTMSASDGACLGTTTVVVSAIGATGSRSTVGQAQTAGDGTFTAPLTQSLADRTQLEVQVPRLYLDQKVLCLEDTYSVEVVRDADGDGVRDLDDDCPTVNPDGVDNARGCPRLGRTVTASYVAGVVSGVVQFTDRSVSTTTCAQTDHTKVQVLGGGLELLAEAGNYSPLTGRYAIAVDLPLGATYRVHVPEALDRFAGICRFADSGTRTLSTTTPMATV